VAFATNLEVDHLHFAGNLTILSISSPPQILRYSPFVWLVGPVPIYSERKILMADCWWLVCPERKVLLAGG
jgi:hypothetical protein